MKYIVVGASGQVGQEFARYLAPEQAVLLGHEAIDVADAEALRTLLCQLDCDVVVNLAAYHDVNGCEANCTKAFAVNAFGALHVARAGLARRCKVVYFSSDYVFGGEDRRESPYVERDPVAPLNVYGASKVAGECLVRATTDRHLIVRSASLFGLVTSRKGWTFPEMILRRARSGEKLKVVDDQYMSPTYTADLVRTVIGLVQADATGIVHVTNAGGCTWFEFAEAVLGMAGVEGSLEPVSTRAFAARARRPAYSRLESERLGTWGISPMRHWREALRAYLTEREEIETR